MNTTASPFPGGFRISNQIMTKLIFSANSAPLSAPFAVIFGCCPLFYFRWVLGAWYSRMPPFDLPHLQLLLSKVFSSKGDPSCQPSNSEE